MGDAERQAGGADAPGQDAWKGRFRGLRQLESRCLPQSGGWRGGPGKLSVGSNI